MHRRSLPWLPLVGLLLTATACFDSPGTAGTTTGRRCAVDPDCASTERCDKGECKAGCRTDADCTGGVCLADGSCGTKPQCRVDTDCGAGFACTAGKCGCTTDYACWNSDGGVDATRICVAGGCQASVACQADSECTDGRYCGPANVCTAPCLEDRDCGGTSTLGGALTCSNGRCTAPCVSDSVPNGGRGGCRDYEICQLGLCQPAECRTLTDCGDATLYCTDARHGRCERIRRCDPALQGFCGPASDCMQYGFENCPPGFDCTQNVCVALPPCLFDAQCQDDEVCDLGACRRAPSCEGDGDCVGDKECVGGHCLQKVCRGPADCRAGQLCSQGRCQAPDDGLRIIEVKLLDSLPPMEVGQTRQLTAVARDAVGQARPVARFDWTSSAPAIATVSASGLVTAIAPGAATITVGYTRSDARPVATDSTNALVLPATSPSGARVMVVDASTGGPVAGALIRICGSYDPAGACTDAEELTSPSGGAIAFTRRTGRFDVSVRDPAADASGTPFHDVVHLLGIAGDDLLVPLPRNEANARAGFVGSVDFSQVKTVGGTQLGLAGSSIADLASFDTEDLLGQPWVSTVTIPTSIGLGIPGTPNIGLGIDAGSFPAQLTGGVVAAIPEPGTVAGFPLPPIPIKDTVYALGSPGLRTTWSFGGRLTPQLFLSSLTGAATSGSLGGVLPFFGAFDHGIQTAVELQLRPQVLDTNDLDGDGICEDRSKCTSAGDSLPDYRRFPTVNFRPGQPQVLRSEVVTPGAPSGTTQVILVGGAQLPGSGLVPLGIGSASGGNSGGETVLRMAPVHSGLEASRYALLALAQGTGAPNPDGSAGTAPLSARIHRADTLATRVVTGAFLPFVEGLAYSAPTRRLSGTAPATSPALRIALVGARQRVFVITRPAALNAGFRVPSAPGSQPDPLTGSTPRGHAVALELKPGLDLDGLVSLPGDTLLDLSAATTAFSRAPIP